MVKGAFEGKNNTSSPDKVGSFPSRGSLSVWRCLGAAEKKKTNASHKIVILSGRD